MSLHDFLNPNTGAFTYGNIDCNNLNCVTINGLNPSGGGGGGGGGSGIFAQLGYVNHSTQSFGANANEIITWSTPDAENNFGSSAIQLVGGNTFANKSSNNVFNFLLEVLVSILLLCSLLKMEILMTVIVSKKFRATMIL